MKLVLDEAIINIIENDGYTCFGAYSNNELYYCTISMNDNSSNRKFHVVVKFDEGPSFETEFDLNICETIDECVISFIEDLNDWMFTQFDTYETINGTIPTEYRSK